MLSKIVSIIVPVYNVRDYIDACIKSVINQTYSNWELILIDDGSVDGSSEICEKYSSADVRIKCIHNENHGVSYSRNCGLEIASGKYITFLDADDLMDKNFISRMLTPLEKYNVDISVCSYYYKQGTNIWHDFTCGESRYITEKELFENIFLNNKIGGFVWNKMFKRSLIEDIEFDTYLQICEDTYFVCETLSQSKRIFYIAEPLYYYTLRENSAVNVITALITKENTSKYTDLYKRILDSFNLNEQIVQYIQCGIFMSSVSLKCNCAIEGIKRKELISNLDQDCKKYLKSFVTCKQIPLKKKFIVLTNWLFNIRKIGRKVQKKKKQIILNYFSD